MKKKRLKLNELKVKSFVTDEEKNNANTLKGGGRSGVEFTNPERPTPATLCFDCPGPTSELQLA